MVSGVSDRVSERDEEASEQQKLAELAEIELVASGLHWEVPEFRKFRKRVVSS